MVGWGVFVCLLFFVFFLFFFLLRNCLLWLPGSFVCFLFSFCFILFSFVLGSFFGGGGGVGLICFVLYFVISHKERQIRSCIRERERVCVCVCVHVCVCVCVCARARACSYLCHFLSIRVNMVLCNEPCSFMRPAGHSTSVAKNHKISTNFHPYPPPAPVPTTTTTELASIFSDV